jgi:hypothetical protein
MNKSLLASFASAAALLASAPLASGQISSSNRTLLDANVVSSSSPATTTLGAVTFTNHGLVGVGRIEAQSYDAWGETLGSVSGLQVTNWANNGGGNYTGRFNILPDRGYNGDLFSNYASRIQAVDFSFTPYTGTATSGVAQNQFALTYNPTASTKFTYDQGGSQVNTTGLIPDTTSTLGGRTVPFVTNSNGQGTATTTGTTSPINRLTIDAEALVLRPDGSGWFGDEYGANVYHFNSAKEIVGVLGQPAAAVPTLVGSPNFSSEVTPTTGRRGNQGMEGIALSPSGTQLFGLMQSALIQDSGTGNQGRFNTRLMVWDVASDATPAAIAKEFVIQLPIGDDNGTTGGAVANRNFAQSEIIALDDTHLLVLSRDGNGKGVTTATGPVFKSVLLIDLANATDIAGSTFDAAGGDITPTGTTLAPTITPIEWTEAVNLLNTAQLGKFDLNLNGGATANENSLSEKWEGLSLLPTGVANEYFLFVANDNDFISGATKMVGLDGSTLETFDAVTDIGIPVENDTMFLAYRVSITGTAAIPEPASSAALAGLALLGLAAVRRRNVR